MNRIAVLISALALGMSGCGGSTTTVEHVVTEAAPAAASAPAEAPKASQQTPDEIGKRLDLVENNLSEEGLSFKVIGGGLFGVVEKSNWTVCETEPTPGSPIQSDVHIKLIVKRSCE
ncbi:MAG TPA: hypothetical protein VG053_08505 [Solirubrobacteraceae bacterium]|jgi:hypothetical protein|nr:hypothetical protein [Solirubrobacteraceae bacterium]